MTTYRVRYEIDVDADEPLAAARKAHAFMVSPQADPPVLGVAAHDGAGDADFGAAELFDLRERGATATRIVWLLAIHSGASPRIEVCASRESAFDELYDYVRQHWEETFGEEPIAPDPQLAVERFFDVGPTTYVLEDRTLM